MSRIIYTHRYCVEVVYTVYMQLRNELTCMLDCEVRGFHNGVAEDTNHPVCGAMSGE